LGRLEQNQHNCIHRQRCQPGFFARKIQPHKYLIGDTYADSALSLARFGLPNVPNKPWMRRAAFLVISPRIDKAQLAIHRGPYFSGIVPILAVVLPPADRA
jgi:hypothetical protein